MIRCHSFARAGLLGNPSDGYGGKTISMTVANWRTIVEIEPSDQLIIVPADDEQHEYRSLEELARQVSQHGLYGGVRLIKATLARLHAWYSQHGIAGGGNFTVRYQTNIPRGVGLAGSSAIITAALKALTGFLGQPIESEVLASLALSVEREVLGIPAGLQDRVIQMLGGVVFMDFSPAVMSGEPGLLVGNYESLPAVPPAPLYIAWDPDASQPTEVLHNDLAARYRRGDPEVLEAMRQFAEFADAGRTAWLAGDGDALGDLMNRNFDLRSRICQIYEPHRKMVETARGTGATAKFCGSGGAIIGTLPDDSAFEVLQQAMTAVGCCSCRPVIGPPERDTGITRKSGRSE